MAIVYFDQRVWIDLLKSSKGINAYLKYENIYNKVIETSDSFKHIYPISVCHFIETQKRSDDRSRNELLKLILETSKFNSIIIREKILNLEVRNAILTSLNIEKVDLTNKVFGKGLDHCFGTKKSPFRDIRDPDVVIDMLNYIDREYLVRKDIEREKKLAKATENLREKLLNHPDKLKRRDIAEAYEHWKYTAPRITEEMIKLGLLPVVIEEICDQIFSSKESFREFIKDSPSIYIFQIMDYARNSNISRKIRPNDLYDLQCLSIASAYCDIVVTEREWANILNQNNIGEIYKTKILHKIEDLEHAL